MSHAEITVEMSSRKNYIDVFECFIVDEGNVVASVDAELLN